MSDRDDFITKIIQKEIRDRKSKSETRDIISTSRNSEDDGYTRLLNKMASKIKKKKKKKSKTVQVENENASIPAEYDIVKLNTVMTSVDTIVPKKAKKRKRQTSCNVDGNDLKIDLMMSKIKKAKMNKITAAEDDLPQTYFLDKQDKKKKKKKKKSHDLSVDEIINDYEMKSKTSDCNTTTINTVESSEDINENTLLSEKLDKKRKKKKKKSRDLRIDEIINDFKMMSKVPDSNKTTINTVESSDDINEITFSLEKQDKKRKKKKKKSCNLSINEIINNYKMMSKVPENIKTTINTVESSDVINEKALGIEKQEKKKKKKSRDLSIDEIINDYKMKSKISDSNTISINSVKSSDDINENKLLLHTSKKKKKKKAEKVQSNNGNPFIQNKDELNYIEETNISVPKKLKKKNRQKSCDISYNDLEADCIMTQNIPKIIQVPSNLINSSTSSEDSDDNMKSPILPKTQKKKKKEMSSKNVMEAMKVIGSIERNTRDYKLRRIVLKENMVNDVSIVNIESSDGVSHQSDTCKMSSLRFSSRHELRTVAHAPDNRNRLIECGVCSRVFGTKSNLTKHYRTHTGEKPYTYDECGNAFTLKSNLVVHHRTHTGEKPYVCDICSKRFTQQDHLGRHYRIHTGEKPYVCDICSKAFARKDHLVTHFRTHTGEKLYECSLCEKSFSQSSHRDSHTLRMHTRRL